MSRPSEAWREPSPDRAAIASKTLLDLFSPATDGAETCPDAGTADQRELWAADAWHRARNLAQMATSLGSSGLRHLHGLHADDHAAEARGLARAYAELGATAIVGRDVPCGSLLEVVAARLIGLFAGGRSIRLHASLDYVVLPAEQRRALVLIASELVVNALKHAFPVDGSGTIAIMLTQSSDTIELTVADSGGGTPPSRSNGSGNGLMQRLAALLQADIHRLDSPRGLKVVVRMPCATR